MATTEEVGKKPTKCDVEDNKAAGVHICVGQGGYAFLAFIAGWPVRSQCMPPQYDVLQMDRRLQPDASSPYEAKWEVFLGGAVAARFPYNSVHVHQAAGQQHVFRVMPSPDQCRNGEGWALSPESGKGTTADAWRILPPAAGAMCLALSGQVSVNIRAVAHRRGGHISTVGQDTEY
ncbi:hypothetical protein CERSUDRAFT_90024 [Gelatoporia subvermispora B]|uniref:Uncharacterized protein n=1 Tax=Ceriporiopsis subvermispora (strain B) TaxID=914234 RepID=M2QWJ5_CERS8|nr:hypothetical protein CERSUDRAFT_90024 [Gelatoporia subvermispora B]